jgi:hypothetical protein
MKYSKSQHFWAWFKQHHTSYMEPLREQQGYQYLYGELYAHIQAYQRFLGLYIFHGPGGRKVNELVITADGNSKYFGLVKRLVAKAPVLPGWEFIALHPPRPVAFFIGPMLQKLGIDGSKLWFMPVNKEPGNPRIGLTVYSETYKELGNETRLVIDRMVYNVLGEELYGALIDEVLVDSVFELRLNDRGRLMNLGLLRDHLAGWEVSQLVVNAQGRIEQRK